MNEVIITYRIIKSPRPGHIILEITREGHGTDWIEEHGDIIEQSIKDTYGKYGYNIPSAERLD